MTARPWVGYLLILLGAALLSVAFCSAAHAAPPPQKKPSWAKPLAIYGSCAAADLLSTERALALGNVEVNPRLQGSTRRVVLKSVQVVGLTLIDREIYKRSPKVGKAVRVVAAVVHIVVSVRNLRLPRQPGAGR